MGITRGAYGKEPAAACRVIYLGHSRLALNNSPLLENSGNNSWDSVVLSQHPLAGFQKF